MAAKWSSRFERKPGRWVFVPTPETKCRGDQIRQQISSVWQPPEYYFHLLKGGHVKALQMHTQGDSFLRLDIEDFFGKINRTRVTRCLKDLVGYDCARDIAKDSTVRHPTEPDRWVLPYGFVQSPLLASIGLARSRLGTALDQLHALEHLKVSVYVDDIIVSGRDIAELAQVKEHLTERATLAGLRLSLSKCEGPAAQVTAFNVALAHESMAVTPERLDDFAAALTASASTNKRQGIVGYVRTINASQSAQLEAISASSST